MKTVVHSRADLPTIRRRLVENVLDPSFEEYGNFIMAANPGVTRFWGNFYDWSAVFQVDTDDPALVAEMTALVRANQATPAYAAAKAERKEQQRQRLAEEADRHERARRGLR